MCISHIKRHINKLPLTQIFTTRHLLIYGCRATVDSVLSRMVKRGLIQRLARGVFVRDGGGKPTLTEIVNAKLGAFGGKVVEHVGRLRHKLKLQQTDDAFTFATAGSSSSFNTVFGRVFLKNNCSRKLKLYTTNVGQAVVALWEMEHCSTESVRTMTASFGRPEREHLRHAGCLMPQWLNELCEFRYSSHRMNSPNPFI